MRLLKFKTYLLVILLYFVIYILCDRTQYENRVKLKIPKSLKDN